MVVVNREYILLFINLYHVAPVPQYPQAQVEGGKDHVAPPALPLPPAAVGPPLKDGYESSDKNPNLNETQSKGDGFWRGWYSLSL